MARLSPAEFEDLIEALATHHGFGRLQRQFKAANILVSRGVAKPSVLARRLFDLSFGLGRPGALQTLILSLWEELVASKLEKADAERLEGIATQINDCLNEEVRVRPERSDELARLLRDYQGLLGEKTGASIARLTMLTRAVPDVAAMLRGASSEGP